MTTDRPRLPGKEELQRQQLYLTNEKLKIENRKLDQETKPEKWWSKLIKNALAFGGVVTVAATIFGIWDSYNKTIVDRERTRNADQQTRFEDAIKRLESSSTISKLVGVSVLSGYLGSPDKEVRHQVLFTLAGLMATEKDFQTQAAVINLIESIAMPNVLSRPRAGWSWSWWYIEPMLLLSAAKGGSITPADWDYFQEMLVTQSRALMAKGNLSHHRHFQSSSLLSDEEQAARTIGKLIAINISKGNAPKRVNYRGIYCKECDFRGATFPQGVDFTGAVLDGANFTGANLVAALFDNAELAGTKFVESDLRQARFRSMDETIVDTVGNDRVPVGRTTYLGHIASALDIYAAIDIRMPNFSCANLQDAAFGRHALFPGVMGWQRVYTSGDEAKPGWYQNVPKYLKDQAQKETSIKISPVQIVPPKFFKANIKSARLEEIRFFTFSDTNAEYPFYMSSSQGQSFGDVMLLQGLVNDEVLQIEIKGPVKADVRLFQQRLRAAFYSVEFDQASLPANVINFLKSSKPTLDDYQAAFRRSPIAPDDLDLQCTPRR
jgi:uncharacterized protein YjbI with pentapeptide repeats